MNPGILHFSRKWILTRSSGWPKPARVTKAQVLQTSSYLSLRFVPRWKHLFPPWMEFQKYLNVSRVFFGAGSKLLHHGREHSRAGGKVRARMGRHHPWRSTTQNRGRGEAEGNGGHLHAAQKQKFKQAGTGGGRRHLPILSMEQRSWALPLALFRLGPTTATATPPNRSTVRQAQRARQMTVTMTRSPRSEADRERAKTMWRDSRMQRSAGERFTHN